MVKMFIFKNKEILIDDEDKVLFTTYSYYFTNHGYIARNHVFENGKRINQFLHNDVLKRFPEKGFCADHINRNKLDNRKSNLRVIPHHLNDRNIQKRVNCSSNFIGVSRMVNGRYKAYFTLNGKTTHLGVFETEQLAAAAYNDFSKRNGTYEIFKNDIPENISVDVDRDVISCLSGIISYKGWFYYSIQVDKKRVRSFKLKTIQDAWNVKLIFIHIYSNQGNPLAHCT